MRWQFSIRALLALFAFASLLVGAAGNCVAQLPDLSPEELAKRHDAMVARVQTLEIVTDTSYGPQWKLYETNKSCMEGDQRRFIIEPLNRDHSCTDCYFDGKTLFRIQRRNADLQIPKKVSIYGSGGVIGIIQEGGDIRQLNYALWVAMLRFRLTIFDRDWSLPELVEASIPPATSEVVLEQSKYLYKIHLHHPGVETQSVVTSGHEGGDFTIFLDPNRNFAAIRTEGEFVSDAGIGSLFGEWTLAAHGDWARSDNIWIPTETIWECLVDGKPGSVRRHQNNIIEINQPLDPSIMRMDFPENMIVSEMDKTGTTGVMHLIDDKGAFKETFKDHEELQAWHIRAMLGLPRVVRWFDLWPHVLGCFAIFFISVFLWRTFFGARKNEEQED